MARAPLNTTHPLLAAALAARQWALAPLTGVKVGAALETADGAIVTGCNVESPSAIFTLCAERVALVKALSEGHRACARIAVISYFRTPIPPCGFCRQLLFEYAPDCEVMMATLDGQTRTAKLADLLPNAYRIEDRKS